MLVHRRVTSGSTDGEVCCIWNRFQMPSFFLDAEDAEESHILFLPRNFRHSGIPAFPTLWPRKNRDHVFFLRLGVPFSDKLFFIILVLKYEPFFSGIMNSMILVYHIPLLKTQFFQKITRHFLFFAVPQRCARWPGEVLISNDGATILSSRGVWFLLEMLIQLIQKISDLPGKP